MTYFPHSENEINQMLSEIGLKDLEDLKTPIPKKYHLDPKSITLDNGKNELEITTHFNKIAGKNKNYSSIFLGAGAYNHYIPATVDEITSRQEFYTAYTPYQPEISQGTLRAIFEYQTYITQLTGMEYSNASMYDGATALAESVLIAHRSTRRSKVLVDKFIHPDYLEVLKTYLKPLDISIEIYNSNPYEFNTEEFKKSWSADYACFVIASPNYCGSLLNFSDIAETIHSDKALLIQIVTEALTLPVIKTPAECGVDIVCGEAQSFGMPLGFGGPFLGFIACTKAYLRKLPGRIVGQTIDSNDEVVYALTLSAREQHIRRESATSNICSNHSLCALRASVYLSTLGANGLRECSLKNIETAHKLQKEIDKLDNFDIVKNQIFFNEFIVNTKLDYSKIKSALEENDILSFLPLGTIDNTLSDSYLVCATEMNTTEELEIFVNILRSIK